ncbi:hypothetical protein B0H14DRAFT_2644465 [Mycena olivaceomarginata]|nr:hypothetical protein B0H14DRAFT_2644465 [Mycena olivaceomarginata]
MFLGSSLCRIFLSFLLLMSTYKLSEFTPSELNVHKLAGQGQTQVLLLVSDVPNSYLRNTSFWLHLRIFGVSLREDLYWVQDSGRRMNQTWRIVTQLFSIVRKNVKFEGSSEFDSRLRLTLISHLYVFSLPAHCSTTANAWSTKLNLDRTWSTERSLILFDGFLPDNHDNYGFDLRTSIALPPVSIVIDHVRR